jgi:hypothetical protein
VTSVVISVVTSVVISVVTSVVTSVVISVVTSGAFSVTFFVSSGVSVMAFNLAIEKNVHLQVFFLNVE